MKLPLLKTGLLGAALFVLISLTSCTYDPYGTSYGTAYGSYTYSNYPYGYTTGILPRGYTSIYLSGTRYWHCNDHYYRHYPGRGYVVVRPPSGRPVYHHRPSHRKPTKYTHYRGDRYIYQNRPNHSHRGTGPQAVPSARSGSGEYPNRYSTVRTNPSSPRTVRPQPVSVRPMSTPTPSSRKVKSRPTNQSSTWKSDPPSGGSTIRRNPSNSHSGMSRSAPSRSAPSRSAASRGSGARRGR